MAIHQFSCEVTFVCRELNSNGMCCRFTDDGDYIAVALSNGDIKVGSFCI